MTPILAFAIIAIISLLICHFFGSTNPARLNLLDTIFAPIFNIALTGLVISVLYQVAIFLKGVHP